MCGGLLHNQEMLRITRKKLYNFGNYAFGFGS